MYWKMYKSAEKGTSVFKCCNIALNLSKAWKRFGTIKIYKSSWKYFWNAKTCLTDSYVWDFFSKYKYCQLNIFLPTTLNNIQKICLQQVSQFCCRWLCSSIWWRKQCPPLPMLCPYWVSTTCCQFVSLENVLCFICC